MEESNKAYPNTYLFTPGRPGYCPLTITKRETTLIALTAKVVLEVPARFESVVTNWELLYK